MQTRSHHSLLPAFAVAALLVASLAFSTTADAQQVPDVLPYQGFVTNGAGAPVDGAATITFRLYRSQADATPIWTETHTNLPVSRGVFYAYLGMQSDVSQFFRDGTTLYLGLDFNNDGEATPRQEIGSVPYAMLANNALNLNGQPADNFLTEQEIIQLVQQYAWKPYILGLTAHSDNGRWEYNGQKGIAAAHSACRDQYPNEPNAHMCTAGEYNLAFGIGSYPASALDGEAGWVLSESLHSPGTGRVASSLGNNCQDLLYHTGDAAVGVTARLQSAYVSIGGDPGNEGLAVELRPSISCQGSFKAQCCRCHPPSFNERDVSTPLDAPNTLVWSRLLVFIRPT